MKPYISIAEQISLLESRNIIITNYKFAHRVLEYENYYCVISEASRAKVALLIHIGGMRL